MKRKNTLILLVTVIFGWVSMGYHNGPANNGQAVSGAPFNSFVYCNGCHFGGSFAPSVSVSLLSGSTTVTSYTAGNSYTVHITMTAGSGTPSGYGFQVTCAMASNYSNINNWGTLPSNTQNISLSSRNYVEQSNTLSSGTVNIPWTAPTAGTGTVKFYLAGNIVNGDNSDFGDSPARDSLSITENSCIAPTLSTTVTNVSCFGGNDGAIALTTTGGSSPFTYQWTGPGSFTASTQNISGLSSGAYKIVVTASGGCKDSITVNVTQPAAVTASALSNSPICVGSALNLSASSSASGATYSWTGPNGFTSSSQNPTIANAATSASGTYSVIASSGGCSSSAATVTVTVDPVPSTPVAGSNGPLCAGSTLNLTSSSTPGVVYSWSGPNSFTSGSQNPSIPNITTAGGGTYFVSATNSCATSTGSVSVTVNSTPAVPLPGSNSPICVGNTLNLSISNTITGVTYSWTGPNSFTSASSNPSISNATTAAGGTYSVTAAAGGCTSAGAVSVTVNQVPATPTASSNNPVCTSDNLSLNASTTTSGVNYSWTGPNSFTSGNQNPVITNVSVLAAGTYSVTAAIGACTSASGTVSVTVNQTPFAPSAGSNSPLCAGDTLNLTSSGYTTGTTCSWTGPNSFATTTQNPSIPNAVAAASGTYSVVAIANGCTSTAATVSVTVNAIPATPLASSSSPVCTGNTLSLTANSSPSPASYSWTGPNSFTSVSQNPSLTNVTTAQAGTYSVTATLNNCTSAAGTVNVIVNQTPAVPSASSNTPLCSGDTLNLTGNSSTSGVNYSWTGPNSFTSGNQNPIITNVSVATSGTYSVTATANNCTSAAGTVNVTVNLTPVISSASNSPVCNGHTLNFTTTNSVSGATYTWSGPNSFTSAVQNPSINSAAFSDSGVYIVTATVNGCTSNSVSDTVTILPVPGAPSVTASANFTTINTGQSVTFTANVTNGGSTPVYQWFKNGTNIPGATSSPYITSAIVNGDVFDVKVSSSLPCAFPDTAGSNGITIAVIPTGINNIGNDLVDMNLYPNPSNGIFTINGTYNSHGNSKTAKIEIANVLGQTVYNKQLILKSREFVYHFNLSGQLQNGVYFLNISLGDERRILRLTIE